MNDRIGDILAKVPALRRMAWRFGRRLYTWARHEQIASDIQDDGEGYIQSCVVRNAERETCIKVIDIGANQGDWTKHLLSQMPREQLNKGRFSIDLFEPVPSTRERLFATLRAIDPDNLCTVHPLAMSDRRGSFQMAIMSETGGTNSLHFDGELAQPPGGWLAVETQTLTHFCTSRGIEKVHLVKCDTEGHDLKVMRGARELLAAQRIDVFQFEYNHRWVYSRSFLKDVFELIEGLPYKLGRVVPGCIEILPQWHPELDRFFQSNYVLIAEDALGLFKLHQGIFDGSNTYA